MATIGRSRAIAMVQRMHLSGFIAWLAWLVVHIWYLIGFRNRLVVMITLGLVVLHLPARRAAHHGPRASTLTRHPMVPWYA